MTTDNKNQELKTEVVPPPSVTQTSSTNNATVEIGLGTKGVQSNTNDESLGTSGISGVSGYVPHTSEEQAAMPFSSLTEISSGNSHITFQISEDPGTTQTGVVGYVKYPEFNVFVTMIVDGIVFLSNEKIYTGPSPDAAKNGAILKIVGFAEKIQQLHFELLKQV